MHFSFSFSSWEAAEPAVCQRTDVPKTCTNQESSPFLWASSPKITLEIAEMSDGLGQTIAMILAGCEAHLSGLKFLSTHHCEKYASPGQTGCFSACDQEMPITQPWLGQPNCDRWDKAPLAITERWLTESNDWTCNVIDEFGVTVHSCVRMASAHRCDWCAAGGREQERTF